MPSYKAPTRDMKFVMQELLGAGDQLAAMPFTGTTRPPTSTCCPRCSTRPPALSKPKSSR